MCSVLERREGSAYGCRRYSGKPRQIYDNPTGNEAVPVTGPLAAYLALLHVCGPEALEREFVPEIDADIFSVWNATGPDLKAVLKREGGRIVCPELGTRYPAAA